MADSQPHPNYHYTPSSAQSTRHLLDTTSPSPSTPTSSTTGAFSSDPPHRPAHASRKSSNYAEADSRARTAIAATHNAAVAATANSASVNTSSSSSSNTSGVRADQDGAATPASPSASWKPRYGRKQSWNQQDFKREMHMSAVVPDGQEAPGFTEAGGKT